MRLGARLLTRVALVYQYRASKQAVMWWRARLLTRVALVSQEKYH